MDGRSGAAGTGGKQRAVGRNRGLARPRGHGLRRRTDGRAGTSKAGQTDGQADGLADGPNRVKILARNSYFSSSHLMCARVNTESCCFEQRASFKAIFITNDSVKGNLSRSKGHSRPRLDCQVQRSRR